MSKSISLKSVLDTLVDAGHITVDQLNTAFLEEERTGQDIQKILVSLNFLKEELLLSALQETTGAQECDLKTTVIETNLLARFEKHLALKFRALPLFNENGNIYVALADPSNVMALDELKRWFHEAAAIIPMVAPESDLLDAIEVHYAQQIDLDALILLLESKSVLEESPIIQMVNGFVMEAVKKGASDVHFEPEEFYTRVRYRIDGQLHQIRVLHKKHWPALCGRLKIMAGMNIAEKRKPQSGRFAFHVGARNVDCRVSAHPTFWGENIVLRLLDKKSFLMDMHQLGFEPDDQKKLVDLALRPGGLTILTGPTGSGKTTTLYALLEKIKSSTLNIMTLEEPIEYELPLIRQTEIQDEGATEYQALNFVDGIRSILRQDPDVILVGEIRDQETAQMALRAAMTGHHVFTTLHTNDVFGVFQRFEDLGVSPSILAGNINAVVAQRLVRTLCAVCKKQDEEGEWVSEGCENCHFTGFKGRVAVSEILEIDEELNTLIAEKQPITKLKSWAQSQGFDSMKHNALRKIQSGRTTYAEVERHLKLDGKI